MAYRLPLITVWLDAVASLLSFLVIKSKETRVVATPADILVDTFTISYELNVFQFPVVWPWQIMVAQAIEVVISL